MEERRGSCADHRCRARLMMCGTGVAQAKKKNHKLSADFKTGPRERHRRADREHRGVRMTPSSWAGRSANRKAH